MKTFDLEKKGAHDEKKLPITEAEIIMIQKVRKLHMRGSDAVVKCKKDGVLAVYEMTRNAV